MDEDQLPASQQACFPSENERVSKLCTFLRESKPCPTKLVNDPTWDIEERVPNAAIWKEHYNNIFMSMKITKELLEKEGVKEIEYSALFVQ